MSNFSYNVAQLRPDGDMLWSKGNIVTAQKGNLRRDINNTFERRDYGQQADWVPHELRGVTRRT